MSSIRDWLKGLGMGQDVSPFRDYDIDVALLSKFDDQVPEDIGDNLRMDYTAVGDITNLAARLKQHADPGTIIIGEARRCWRPPLPRIHSASRDAFTSGRGARDRGHQLAHPPIYGDRPCT